MLHVHGDNCAERREELVHVLVSRVAWEASHVDGRVWVAGAIAGQDLCVADHFDQRIRVHPVRRNRRHLLGATSTDAASTIAAASATASEAATAEASATISAAKAPATASLLVR